VGVFFGILPFLLPLPFMLMGVLVCVVQAVVFSLLTTVYISQAVAHEEH
jgi:F-type H+-transporting ATPase subunit a